MEKRSPHSGEAMQPKQLAKLNFLSFWGNI
jgi:hypothetical protein